jgi:hypothetical protein
MGEAWWRPIFSRHRILPVAASKQHASRAAKSVVKNQSPTLIGDGTYGVPSVELQTTLVSVTLPLPSGLIACNTRFGQLLQLSTNPDFSL